MIDWKKELEKCNKLSPSAAKSIIEKFNGRRVAVRSCWYCNPDREHLKDADYPFICAVGERPCGHLYIGGYPAIAVQRRSEGELVEPEDLEALQDPDETERPMESYGNVQLAKPIGFGEASVKREGSFIAYDDLAD